MVSFVSANVSAEDFFNRNTSAVEQRAGELAVIFFLEQNTATVLTDSGFGQSSAVIIAPTVVVFLLLLLVVAVFITIGTFIAFRHRSKRYTYTWGVTDSTEWSVTSNGGLQGQVPSFLRSMPLLNFSHAEPPLQNHNFFYNIIMLMLKCCIQDTEKWIRYTHTYCTIPGLSGLKYVLLIH